MLIVFELYLFTSDSSYTSHRYKEFAGFEGVIAGCLVAVKQILPENEVVLLGVIRFRAKV
jgi:hypothetical protein